MSFQAYPDNIQTKTGKAQTSSAHGASSGALPPAKALWRA